MSILLALMIFVAGAAVGYGLRAWIGKELVVVKDRLTKIEGKVRSRA